jgi:hypothetical protein
MESGRAGAISRVKKKLAGDGRASPSETPNALLFNYSNCLLKFWTDCASFGLWSATSVEYFHFELTLLRRLNVPILKAQVQLTASRFIATMRSSRLGDFEKSVQAGMIARPCARFAEIRQNPGKALGLLIQTFEAPNNSS